MTDLPPAREPEADRELRSADQVGAVDTDGLEDEGALLDEAELGPIELPPSQRDRRGKPSGLRSAIEWVVVIGASLGFALLIQAFVFQPFRIPSASMYPALHVGDRIVVNKLSYRTHDVHRGDVVVFTRPDCNQTGEPTWANCALLGKPR